MCVYGHLQTPLHSAAILNEETFYQHIFHVCQTIRNCPVTFEMVWQSVIRSVPACMHDSGGGYFEHFKMNYGILNRANSTVIKLVMSIAKSEL